MSLVVWVALGWSQSPADKEHPYGHMKGEAVIGSNIALLLVASAVAFLASSDASYITGVELNVDGGMGQI